MKTIFILRSLTIALLAVALCLAGYRYWRSSQLDDFGPVGEFSLIGTNGPITHQDINNKVTVVACFFTCCTTSCPVLSGKLAQLQSELADLPDLRLISLTVDPEHDTPEKLSAYAQTFGANPARWWFLTGEQPAIETLIRGRLKLGIEKNTSATVSPGTRYDHSEKLTLIDRHGHIRGWFTGTSAEGIEELKRAIRQLHG